MVGGFVQGQQGTTGQNRVFSSSGRAYTTDENGLPSYNPISARFTNPAYSRAPRTRDASGASPSVNGSLALYYGTGTNRMYRNTAESGSTDMRSNMGVPYIKSMPTDGKGVVREQPVGAHPGEWLPSPTPAAPLTSTRGLSTSSPQTTTQGLNDSPQANITAPQSQPVTSPSTVTPPDPPTPVDAPLALGGAQTQRAPGANYQAMPDQSVAVAQRPQQGVNDDNSNKQSGSDGSVGSLFPNSDGGSRNGGTSDFFINNNNRNSGAPNTKSNMCLITMGSQYER